VKLLQHLVVVFTKGVTVASALYHRLLAEQLEILEKEVSQREKRRVSRTLQHKEDGEEDEVGNGWGREMSLQKVKLDKQVERTELGTRRQLLAEGREETVWMTLKRDGQLDSRFLCEDT